MALTLEQLNHLDLESAVAALDGIYEHSPWVVREALALRPFASVAHLCHVLATQVQLASDDQQRALIRAHPPLRGQCAKAHVLTPDSAAEQQRAGLTHCSADQVAELDQRNHDYLARMGFPFVLAVRGPRATGLTPLDILHSLRQRGLRDAAQEQQECLRQIHRIAELRLHQRLAYACTDGDWVWDRLADLARHSEDANGLTVTYLSAAHRACAQQLARDFAAVGCDQVHIDVLGNVVGRYEADSTKPISHEGAVPISPKTLLTGSHYDTVRHGGRFDGRLGIYVPLACVRTMAQQGRRLPFALEIVAFAEEEGQRFGTPFLASSALTGHFNAQWLTWQDAHGTTLAQALQASGADLGQIAALARHAADYLGFVEIHIEQGPVLAHRNLPLGVVHAINACARLSGHFVGCASHAGTTPMGLRRDAAAGAAELVLAVERLASAQADSVGTVGVLQVPDASVNVVPGSCHLTLDLRATSTEARDQLIAQVLEAAQDIAQRRGLQWQCQETLRADAAPCDVRWQARWENAVAALGLPVQRLPSGAGHDAMQMHRLLAQAMLFVRGENQGISHNASESSTSSDIDLAVRAMQQLLLQLSTELQTPPAGAACP